MQNICVTGGVTKDLELREGKNDVYVLFSLAVNQGFGEEPSVNYYQCYLYGYDAKKIVNAKVKKGSRLLINGRFTIESYTANEGTVKIAYKINVFDWEFTGLKPNHKIEITSTPTEDFDIVAEPDEKIHLNDDDDLPY